MKYVIANWKENKTVYQAVDWIHQFTKMLHDNSVHEALKANQLKIIICPALPFIPYFKQITLKIPNVDVGAQNVSHLEEGSHTGEVSASMLNGLVEYTIVGHSERRSILHETEEELSQKIAQLKKNQIHTILCVRNEKDSIYEDADLVTFEPVEAIGSGHNMSVDEVLQVRQKLSIKPHQLFLYGGSVTPENCHEYLQNAQIDGVLIGKASLDPTSFFQLAEGALNK
jgi:triosephosphate isomerase